MKSIFVNLILPVIFAGIAIILSMVLGLGAGMSYTPRNTIFLNLFGLFIIIDLIGTIPVFLISKFITKNSKEAFRSTKIYLLVTIAFLAYFVFSFIFGSIRDGELKL